MATLDPEYINRGIGRRKEDLVVRDQNRQYKQLFHVGQVITSEINLNALFEIIIDQTNRILGTERSTVFLYDNKIKELWSLVATGIGKNKIHMPADAGAAGWTFHAKTPLKINDAYNDARFYFEVDRWSGFRTRNILCFPVINRTEQCLGVIQALNKKTGDFTDEDIEMLSSISNYAAIALENATLYEEVKNYSKKIEATLHHIETLEKVKNQLTKFVPSSVAKLVEQDPNKLTLEKTPKDVTILFIDIQEFSRITESFDQRLVNEMLECHFSSYLDCIRRHGGEINETFGDGLMVIFQQESLEYNAREAVSAGLEIISENIQLNDEFSYPWGRVELHLGMNSGRAWVGSTKLKSLAGERWTYTASGLVTILAARIGTLSSGTRLYVGFETYRCIENFFDCEFIGHHKIKNVKDPVPIFEVINFLEAV